jgi:hypothetical protein
MAKTDRREAAPPQAVDYPVVALPGIPSALIWDELADEAKTYLALLERLKVTPLDAPEREGLEDEIISSLNHLVVHGSVLYSKVDEAIENSEDVALS